MQAIILAGGFGTRLRSVIADVPKPMAPIGNKPFLEILLDSLLTQGFTEVVLAVYHLKETIIDYFGDHYQSIKITYAVEDTPLGTGGAIINSLSQINAAQPVFIINGDTFVELDCREMLLQHELIKAELSMAVYEQQDCSRYGNIIINEQKKIIAFEHKKQNQPGLINAGVYLFSKILVEQFKLPLAFSFEQDFLFPAIKELNAYAFLAKDYFIDIGIPEDYQKICKDFASKI